ncbi:MAG: recombinase family protein [Roseiflexaceae bacterium]
MAPKRAINYARVSTPRQAELYSLDYQLDEMRLYDADMGLLIVAEFKEDKSARKIDRDYLEEACQMLERGEADVLVTWKFDRLHRNYVNSIVLRDRLRRVSKEIHYAQTRTVSGKMARQRLPEDIQYIMAEIEADDILERTAGGKRRKIEQGQKWSGSNKPPYGYRAVGHGQEAEMVLDEWEELSNSQQGAALLEHIAAGEIIPETMEAVRQGRATSVVVRWVFAWYVYGDSESGPMSTQKVAKKLTVLGVPTPADIVPARAHLKKRAYGQW